MSSVTRATTPATIVRQLCGGILDTVNQFDRYRPAEGGAGGLGRVLRHLPDLRARLEAGGGEETGQLRADGGVGPVAAGLNRGGEEPRPGIVRVERPG